MGYAVYFTGAFDEAENWTKAVKGTWTEGNVWKVSVTATEGIGFEWKALKGSDVEDEYVVTIKGNSWEWQPDPNNSYPTKSSTTF